MGKSQIMKILAVGLAVLLVIGLSACGNRDEGPPVTEQPTEFIPDVETLGEAKDTEADIETEAATAETEFVETVAYYLDDAGRLVPLARTIPKTTGVAKATLSLLVADENNSMEIARLGLKPVLPANTQLDLDINDGLARVDLQGTIQNEDAAEEAGMVYAIVETLTQFDSVDSVQILINGMNLATLPFGTPIEKPIARGDINLEGSSDLSEEGRIKLFFGSETGSMIVPVTRMVYSTADIETAVVELIKGPKAESGLKPSLPKDCGLIGVTVENGVASINFTNEFIDVTQQSDGGRLALKALVLTCSQFKGIREVKLLVDGKEYDPGVTTMATPKFVNEVDFLSNIIDAPEPLLDTVSADIPTDGAVAGVLYVGDEVIVD